MTVHGYIVKPHAGRANRSMQHFFVNGRYVKSRLMQAAMEEAYRNAIITGKYPSGALFLDLPLSAVDVNVHPAKTEVKFSQEKPIFEVVYIACKNALACAAACARLYYLDAQGIEDAIALATTMTGGLLSYGDSRPAIKPLNPGKAAENGVFAAMLANEGVRGPAKSLEGQNGWFHAVTDEVHEEFLKGSDHLLLHDCYFKLYPSCRHTHCTIDAAIALYEKVSPKDIEAINVYIYPNAIKLAGIKIPKDQDETKFSIPYTLACALLNGSYGMADMDPPRLTPDVLDLIERTHLISDVTMEDRPKDIRGARVEIILKNGAKAEETVLVPKGDPENPLTKNDIIKKLRVCAQGQSDEYTLMKLVKAVETIEGTNKFINPMKIIGAME